MSSDDVRCCKAPILDLLRSTPIDGRATYEEGEGVDLVFHMIPYGHHCHEAADEIDRLRDREGQLFTHVGVDAFWRVWNEIGEPHVHGVYESTWAAFRAALESDST